MHDIIIVGGGLAGSLTAMALAGTAGCSGLSVLVLDRRDDPLDGRDWEYFSTASVAPDAETGTWSALRIRGEGLDQRLPLRRFRYRRISGRLLSRQPALAAVPRRTAVVAGLYPGAEHVRVRLAAGGDLTARWVVDSAFGLPVTDDGPWLSFLGARIRVGAMEADPVLMDLRIPQGDGVRFGYALPEPPGTLFVEATSFHASGPDAGLPAAMDRWLDRAWPGHERTGAIAQRAALPLHRRARRRNHGRVLHIGGAGGRTRRSTGYGVTRYAQDAAAIAARMAATGSPLPLPAPSRRDDWMDGIASRVLADDPAALREAFLRLFARNDPDDALRFLQGDSGAVPTARILRTLPFRPFLRAAAQAALRR